MGAEAVDPQVVERVKTILRRDLKLGPTAVIADDMAFFGGDVDMDSLDILLLVTSIEKEFGIKVPNAAVGREVFENVDTLSRFVEEQQRSGSAGSAGGTAGPASVADPLSRLPHQDPFRFVTRLTELRSGEWAEGVWVVKGDEGFFAGHFPGRPLVPGVLIAEALAQISGLAGPTVTDGGAEEGKLAHVDVRFDLPVAPPAEIVLKSKLLRAVGHLHQFNVEAVVGGVVVARGSLTLHRFAGAGGGTL